MSAQVELAGAASASPSEVTMFAAEAPTGGDSEVRGPASEEGEEEEEDEEHSESVDDADGGVGAAWDQGDEGESSEGESSEDESSEAEAAEEDGEAFFGESDSESEAEAVRMAEEEAFFSARHAPDCPEALAADLEARGAVVSDAWRRAFREVDRAVFVPRRVSDCAYDDAPLRSRDDDGRCVVHLSAPSIYAAALEALDLGPKMSFLNCGSGSGYLSALASRVLGPDAVHHCVERDEVLANRCRRTLAGHFQESCAKVVVHAASCFDVCARSSMRFDRVRFFPPQQPPSICPS